RRRRPYPLLAIIYVLDLHPCRPSALSAGRRPARLLPASRPLSRLFQFLCGKQAACGLYVFAARSTYGSDDTLARKRIAERFHFAVAGAEIGRAGYLVEPYQVDTALQSVEQPGEFLHMGRRIVHARKHDIHETDTPLAGEIVTAQQLHRIAYRKGPLYGHDFRTLTGKRVVQADGHVHPAFVEQAAQPRNDAG